MAGAHRAGRRLPLRYSLGMRTIGRKLPSITAVPSANGLRSADLHQHLGQAMATINSTGIAKGIYRFKTQQEADLQRLDALVRVVAANAVRQRRGP